MIDLPQRNNVPDEVRSLVEGYCAGTLGDDDRNRLESQLRDNERYQAYFLAFMAVHSGLYWSLRDQSPALPSKNTPAPVPEAAFPVDAGGLGGLPSTSRGWFGFGAVLLSAIILVTAVTVAALWRNANPGNGAVAQNPPSKVSSPELRLGVKSTQPVARVDKLESQVLVERAGAKQKAVVGMELLADDSLDVPTGSSAELTLVDDSLAKLGPRTNFAFASAHEATLREGFIQIDSRNRPQGEHLAITTPDAKTQIQGAWMSMAANGKRTQIRVAEGRVLASRRADGMAVEIPEGYCSTIAQAISPTPRLGGQGSALFVVTTRAMHVHEDWERFDQILADRIVGDRLWRSAMPVRMRTYDELRASDFENCSLIVLSVFPRDAGVEQKLIDLKVPELPTPIVCLEPVAFPTLGMTGPTKQVDFGFDRGPLVVDVVTSNHPLAAGFVGTGLELFAYRESPYGWGKPNSAALKILRPRKRKDRCLFFAYEQGAAMVNGMAPARRVGLFMIPIGADYNSPGLDLIDAAIDWCLEPFASETAAHLNRAAAVTHGLTVAELPGETERAELKTPHRS